MPLANHIPKVLQLAQQYATSAAAGQDWPLKFPCSDSGHAGTLSCESSDGDASCCQVRPAMLKREQTCR